MAPSPTAGSEKRTSRWRSPRPRPPARSPLRAAPFLRASRELRGEPLKSPPRVGLLGWAEEPTKVPPISSSLRAGLRDRRRRRVNDRHEATATSGRLHRPGAGGDAAARRAGRQPRRPSAARRPVRRRPGARPALREADPAARTSPAVGLDWAVSAEALARRVRRARPGQLRRE